MDRLTDLRYVIGLFFSIAGLILLIAFAAGGDGGKAGGAQVNLYAALVYCIFGFGMLWSSRKPLEG